MTKLPTTRAADETCAFVCLLGWWNSRQRAIRLSSGGRVSIGTAEAVPSWCLESAARETFSGPSEKRSRCGKSGEIDRLNGPLRPGNPDPTASADHAPE